MAVQTKKSAASKSKSSAKAAKPAAAAKATPVAPAKPASKVASKMKATTSAASKTPAKPASTKAAVQAPLKQAPVKAEAPPAPAPVVEAPKEAPAPVAPAAPAVEPPTFNVGDNAVYPGHGVGIVRAIEAKEIFGKRHEFYSIQILENGMKIMIPKDNVMSVGLRPIISRDEAARVISILRETNVKIDNQTWNRRYREYMEKIKTGSVFEIAEVLRDLFLLKVDKELSFGERKMLDTARGLLLKELSLATSREELAGQEEVAAIFGLQGT